MKNVFVKLKKISTIFLVCTLILGLLAGAGGIALRRLPTAWQVVLTVAVAHLIGSVVIKTFGLSQYYSLPFVALMGWRTLNYALVGAAEAALLCVLVQHKGVRRFAKGG